MLLSSPKDQRLCSKDVTAQAKMVKIIKRALPPMGAPPACSYYGRIWTKQQAWTKEAWTKDSADHLCTLNTRLSLLTPSIGPPGQAPGLHTTSLGKASPLSLSSWGLALIPCTARPEHPREPRIHSFHSLNVIILKIYRKLKERRSLGRAAMNS